MAVVSFVVFSGLTWGQHVWVSTRPDYSGSPGEGLGLIFFMMFEAAFWGGAIIRVGIQFLFHKLRGT